MSSPKFMAALDARCALGGRTRQGLAGGRRLATHESRDEQASHHRRARVRFEAGRIGRGKSYCARKRARGTCPLPKSFDLPRFGGAFFSFSELLLSVVLMP